jgi:hypothetical protein
MCQREDVAAENASKAATAKVGAAEGIDVK